MTEDADDAPGPYRLIHGYFRVAAYLVWGVHFDDVKVRLRTQ